MRTKQPAHLQTWQRLWEMFFPWVTGTEDRTVSLAPARRRTRKQ